MTLVKRIGSMLVILVAVATIASSAVRADVLVSNLSAPIRGTTPIGNAHNMIEFWGAQSFFTDANTYTLTSIRAMLRDGAGSPLVVAELRAPDVATNGFTPDTTAGGLLATFTTPDVTGATSPRLFTPIGSVTLLPSTEYWFILGSGNTGTFGWDGTTRTTPLVPLPDLGRPRTSPIPVIPAAHGVTTGEVQTTPISSKSTSAARSLSRGASPCWASRAASA